MPIDASVAGILTAEQIAQTQAKAQAIADAAQVDIISASQFVFFAAFDGTNNDKNNLGDNPYSTNVGQLWDQYNAGRSGVTNLGGNYYAGVGTAERGGFVASAFPTDANIAIAEHAYSDFTNQASAFLRDNPEGSITTALTSYSRGFGSAAIFTQMLYERGLTDPQSGKLLIPPGQIGVSAGVTFDPVTTGTRGDLGFAPNVTNVVNIAAENEYRWMFRGGELTNHNGVTNFTSLGNHGGIGGGYDNGTAAYMLEGATEFFLRSGLLLSNVPAERRFDGSQPVRIYNEGVDRFGNVKWDTYGSFAEGSSRLYVRIATSPINQTFDDGSTLSSYVNWQGKMVNSSREPLDQGGQSVIQILDQTQKLEALTRIDADKTTTIITFGENGVQSTRRYDSTGAPVSTTTPISANGTEVNTVEVSTNTTLDTSQSGSGNPQDVSTVEQGTALGSAEGAYEVSMDPDTLNADHTPAGSAQGTITTDNQMPGGDRISPSEDNWENVDFWAGLQASALTTSFADTAAASIQNEAFNSLWWAADPMILDLNGDGVRLTSYHDRMVLFDIDHDGGTKEQTGWVAANTITTNPPSINTDGILAHDLNSNGLIDDISETLSEYYNGAVGTDGNAGEKRFGNGFAALKSLDSNNDNVFNSADDTWASLRVWVDDNADGSSFKDLNGDGVYTAGVDASELKTFAELGITSVNLANTAQSGMVNGGNEVLATGNFVIGGQTREAQAANFLANPNGHSFINQQNGANSGTRIATQGDGGGTTSYVSHSASGEAMSAAALGVNNLYGGAGNDTLTGDAGDNWLVGGAGADSFNGGAGDDVLLIDASDLQANIQAGSGVDIAQVIGDEGVTLNLSQAELEIVQGGRGNDVIEGGGRSSVFVRGGDGEDILIGGSANDVLSGEEGSDVVDGGDGNDLIRGHRGRDLLFGGLGDDIAQGGMEDDRVSGGSGNDALRGDQGDDALDGGAGTDLAEFSGSFADYRITRIDATTYRVVDTQAGRDGADTLKNIERINFADVSAVDLTLDNPMPVKDVLTVADRNGPKLISAAQLLGNDIDWQADALHITTISDVKGGTIAGTVGPDGEITPTLNGAGELAFTPDPNFTGVMSFKYKIADTDNTPGATAIQVGTGNAAEMRGQVFIKTPDMPTDSIFTDQWYLTDINVLPVWKDYTGKGVRIGQFEPSGPYAATKEILDYRHADLQPNIDVTFLSDKTNVPVQDFSQHATLVAGVMVAARNGEGAVGVAYNAQIAGWQIGDTISVNSPNSVTAEFFHLYKLRDYDVSNNSWGFTGAFENFAVAAPPIAEEFFKPAVMQGRGGLGSNIVMAGGNSRQSGGNTNYSETTNNRFVITTGAINATGDISTLTISQAPFSNPGASILVSAPGSNVASTSRILMNDQGTVFGDDTANVQGTSFATPIISGVVALMLEANPDLGWRDVQQILALSARNVNDPNTDWTYNAAGNWNGGGMHTSHDYGFGDVDARVAVRLAETRVGAHTSYNERHLGQAEGSLASGGSNLGIAIADGAMVTRTLAIGAGIRAEHVNVTVDLNHGNWGDLKVELISPAGTVSKLVTNPGTTADSPGGVVGIGQLKYTFDTTHSYGEIGQGNWQLRITDRSGRGGGTLNGWKVDVYGSDFNETIVGRDQTAGEAPVISATGNDTYFYTDEFATAPGASRATLSDGNGGVDIVNAAAASGNSTLNLNNGATSTIAGRNLTISGDVEHAFGGDGNDTLTGSALSNRLEGGRGSDVINAGAGYDLLDGGQGNDTLTGGAGNDLFLIRNAPGSTDTITDFRPSSMVIDADSIFEKLLLVGFDNLFDWSQITKTQVGADLHLTFGNAQTVILKNLNLAQVTEQATGFISDDDMLDTYTRLLDNATITFGTAGVDGYVPGATPQGARYFGFGGDDQVGTPSTTDLVDGGDGNDLIISDYTAPTPGNDWLEGGAGNDDLQAGGANDVILGGSGNDGLRAGDGDDYLNGGTGLDYLEGGAGNDVLLLEGDQGTVQGTTFNFLGTRVGGAGADVFYVTANGGGSGGLSASGGAVTAFNMVADFDPSQAGEKIDLSAHTWIRGYADLNVQSFILNGTPMARISATNGTQQVWINLRGVDASQINASHFKFAGNFPGVFGTISNDTLTGDAGGNLIDGRAGADSMTGRTGDDTYVVDNAGDMVNELAGGGFDTVQSSVNFTLAAEVDNLVLIEGGSINGTGNAKSNRLSGNAGDNVLDGGSGADTLLGGAGNDTYVIDDQADTVTENAGEGSDSVQSSVSFTLGNHIENLTLIGSDSVNATGNALDNSLTGNATNNILDGAAGADTMTGGAGDDTYYVDNAGDNVVESATGGLDTVYASVNHTLAGNVENLVLHSGALAGTGNELDNSLTGNTANNTLSGGGGFDFLDGGAGADTMAGGSEDDYYVVDNAGDVVTENADQGSDSIESSTSFSLASTPNVENLILTGTAAINATGNAANNMLGGNSAANVLDGGGGNDLLDGGAGADTMIGGAGDDTYEVDNAADVVTEAAGGGNDTVRSSLSFSLAGLSNVENVTLTGSADINATGNGLGNVLVGNSGNNVLTGDAGADTLTGGAGNDTLIGSTGNDVYTFGPGFGQDSLTDNDATGGNVDIVRFHESILPATVSASRSGENLVLTRGTDNITVQNWYASSADKIERVEFADGTAWDVAALRAMTNLAPTLANPIPDSSATEDTAFSFTVAANAFADPDATIGDTLAYDATLADGSALPGWLSFNNTTRTFSGTPANGDVGVLEVRVTATDGLGVSASDVFTVTVANTAPLDFNGDGKSDILWRNRSTGEDYIYHMDGTAILPTEGYIRTVADLNWGIAGTGDFNGDGKSDVLWRNGQSGENYIYFMNGLSIQSEGYIRTVADMNWGIAGTGDFNGDFKSDALWRNSQSGENYIYLMDGLSIQSEGYVRTVTDMNWGIAGTGDFDGDGKSDVLWRNAQSGENYIYFMDGLSLQSEGYIRTVPDMDWAVAGTGDFNGDGKSDVLWRNGQSGQNYIYFMDGLSLQSEGYIRTVPDMDWAVAGTGDYNGDGKSDILWRNSSTGENYLHPMDGLTILPSEGYVRQVPDQSWQPVYGSEARLIGDSLRNWQIGTGAGDLLEGRGGDDALNGRGGNDVLSGGSGTDQLTDTSGQNLLWGGAGSDTLAAGAGNDFLAGGAGNDVIQTGAGQNVISFNAGDGVDSVSSQAGATNVLSFGSGVRYGDLSLSKSGNDLVVNAGGSDSVTLKDWYAGRDDVATLQVMIDASSDYDAESSDSMHNKKVQTFDFRGLAGAFDAARAESPGLTSWALTNALLQWHLSHSDDEALGGDLAYWYSKNSTLTGVGLLAAQQVIGAAGFGSDAQTLRPFSGLQEGLAKLT